MTAQQRTLAFSTRRAPMATPGKYTPLFDELPSGVGALALNQADNDRQSRPPVGMGQYALACAHDGVGVDQAPKHDAAIGRIDGGRGVGRTSNDQRRLSRCAGASGIGDTS